LLAGFGHVGSGGVVEVPVVVVVVVGVVVVGRTGGRHSLVGVVAAVVVGVVVATVVPVVVVGTVAVEVVGAWVVGAVAVVCAVESVVGVRSPVATPAASSTPMPAASAPVETIRAGLTRRHPNRRSREGSTSDRNRLFVQCSAQDLKHR
jgi:hypothetical protein